MKIYMDACCLNRPFDDQAQDRVHLETEAILTILARCESGEWTLSGSDVLSLELSKIPDTEKLEKVRALSSVARLQAELSPQAEDRAQVFRMAGIKLFDSLHLALAETTGQDVFLTTDDRLLRAAGKLDIDVRVANPVTWLMEVMQDGR